MAAHFMSGNINGKDIPVCFASNIDSLATGGEGNSFRFFGQRDDVLDLPGVDVGDAQGGNVFIGDIEVTPIGADGEFFRIAAGGNLLYKFLCGEINHTNPVSAVVGNFIVIFIVGRFTKDGITFDVKLR